MSTRRRREETRDPVLREAEKRRKKSGRQFETFILEANLNMVLALPYSCVGYDRQNTALEDTEGDGTVSIEELRIDVGSGTATIVNDDLREGDGEESDVMCKIRFDTNFPSRIRRNMMSNEPYFVITGIVWQLGEANFSHVGAGYYSKGPIDLYIYTSIIKSVPFVEGKIGYDAFFKLHRSLPSSRILKLRDLLDEINNFRASSNTFGRGFVALDNSVRVQRVLPLGKVFDRVKENYYYEALNKYADELLEYGDVVQITDGDYVGQTDFGMKFVKALTSVRTTAQDTSTEAATASSAKRRRVGSELTDLRF